MKNILQDQHGNKSSKRIAGFSILGVGAGMGIALFIFALIKKVADPDTAMNVYQTMIYSGVGLLGIGVVEFFGKKK